MGRAAKPIALHIASGTFRPDRHGAGDLPVEVPQRPPGMSASKKRWWKSLTEQLEAAGILAGVDGLALKLLVDSIELYETSSDALATEGLVLRGENGAYQNPNLSVRNRAWQQIVLMARQFGMTASSRTGLNLSLGSKNTDLDDRISRLKRS